MLIKGVMLMRCHCWRNHMGPERGRGQSRGTCVPPVPPVSHLSHLSHTCTPVSHLSTRCTCRGRGRDRQRGGDRRADGTVCLLFLRPLPQPLRGQEL